MLLSKLAKWTMAKALMLESYACMEDRLLNQSKESTGDVTPYSKSEGLIDQLGFTIKF